MQELVAAHEAFRRVVAEHHAVERLQVAVVGALADRPARRTGGRRRARAGGAQALAGCEARKPAASSWLADGGAEGARRLRSLSRKREAAKGSKPARPAIVMPTLSASISWLREKVASVMPRAVARGAALVRVGQRRRSRRARRYRACSATLARSSAWFRSTCAISCEITAASSEEFVGQRDQPARHIEVAAGKREGVGDGRVQDGDLVAARGIVGRGDEARHDAAPPPAPRSASE